jgi:hypothetical protein
VEKHVPRYYGTGIPCGRITPAEAIVDAQMTIDEFIKRVQQSSQQKTLLHFTDTRNLPSIRKHGLLCTKRLREAKIEVPALGGNEWSLDADRASGMDAFVHLCFMRNHPMVYRAQSEGMIESVTYLEVRAEVLKLPGTQLCSDVANKSGVIPVPVADGLGGLDLEVIYRRTDWRDPAVNARLQAAHRCEILVPDEVPREFIGNLGRG